MPRPGRCTIMLAGVLEAKVQGPGGGRRRGGETESVPGTGRARLPPGAVGAPRDHARSAASGPRSRFSIRCLV